MPAVPNADIYFKSYEMANALYAGAGLNLTNSFGSYVGGGTAVCVGLPLAIKGAKGIVWDIPRWGYKNYGNYGEAFKAAGQNWKEVNFGTAVKAQRNYFINGVKGSGFFGGIRNTWNLTSLQELERHIPIDKNSGFSKTKYFELKNAGKTEEAAAYLKKSQDIKKAKVNKIDCYKNAKNKLAEIKKGIKNGTLKGKNLGKAISELDALCAKADVEALKITAKPASKLAKFKAALGKYSGAKAVNGALTKGAASSTKSIRYACKGAKSFVKGGGALTAGIEFAFEVPGIIESFRRSNSDGWEHTGKAAAVAVASGVGYWAGAAAGAKLGAAVGTCIGGPIGTVVGGAIGIACGLVGSWLASKGAKAVVGKYGQEKYQKEQAKNTAKEATLDPQKYNELLEAYEKLISGRQEMIQDGAVESTTEQEIICPQDNICAEAQKLDLQS